MKKRKREGVTLGHAPPTEPRRRFSQLRLCPCVYVTPDGSLRRYAWRHSAEDVLVDSARTGPRSMADTRKAFLRTAERVLASAGVDADAVVRVYARRCSECEDAWGVWRRVAAGKAKDGGSLDKAWLRVVDLCRP